MTPKLEKACIVVLAATPPLIAAAAGWLQADAAEHETQKLADNYGSYIEDQMREADDREAIERSLERCMTLLRENQ